jgi:protein involved in polysaccharide export with SLBB domain
LVLAATLLLCASVTAAQTTQDLPEALEHRDESGMPATGPALARTPQVFAGPVDPSTYRIGPGDVFSVEMWGRVTHAVPLEVGPEGTLSLPTGGVVSVAGLTLNDARAQLLERLRREVRDVHIEVHLARARTFRLVLAGEVLKPGPVDASGSTRVGDVLTLERLTGTASHRNIQLLHRDGSRERADLDRLLRAGDNSRNPELRDGDVVLVPAATEWVQVAGAVSAPGRYEHAPDDSVGTLFRMAGGALPSAAPEAALWLHWTGDSRPDSIRLSLADLRDGAGDRTLADGDKLYVYFVPNYRLQHQVAILGEVARPGVYPIREGNTRISEVVGAAGGLLATANRSAIRVHSVRPQADVKDPELDRLLRLSRGELTATEYEVLRTKLAASRDEYRVDWDQVGTLPQLDVLLRDDDVITVDRLVSTIRVDGEVLRPAILSYRSGLSVRDYVRQAGGYTNRAWRGKVRVTRAVSGQTLLARDVRVLDPGDFVWVPEKPDLTIWQQAKDVLSALGIVATIVIAIRSVR